MACEDNVRFLRYLDLQGEGGTLAIRELLKRETSSRSQTLENLLSENKFRFRHSPAFRVLFPNDETVNADIEGWGIDILFQVVTTLFRLSLSSRERSAIYTLHSTRLGVDSNPSETGMAENEYRTIRADLRMAINDIIQGLDENRRQRLRNIVNRSAAEDINTLDTLNRIRRLNEFPTELLDSLEQRFKESYNPGQYLNIPQPSLKVS